jgi:acylglycerol lipase
MWTESRFIASQGVELYEQTWTPETACVAHVVLLHGFAEHSGRYAHVAAAFNQAGIAVHAYDQRGFGHSPGKRSEIRDFNDFLNDLDAFLAHVRPSFGETPWFLMGHSMGGMIMTRYAQTRKFDARGLIFSSPFLAFPDSVPLFLLALSSLLSRLAPWMPVGAVENTGLSRDPEVLKAANADPLHFHGKVIARTGGQFLRAIREAENAYAAITLPSLIVHGTADRVVSMKGTRKLAAECGAADKTFILFEGGYHELWNDLDKEKAINTFRDWILARIS